MRRVLAGLVAGALLALAGCTTESPKTDDVAAAPTGPPCLQATSPSPAQSPSAGVAGKPLPAMAVRCFDGGRYVDAAQLGSVPTILNLWRSNCEPCRTELPAFQRFVTAAGNKVRVVGVIVMDSRPAAQSVIDDKQLTFPMLEDRDQQFAIALSQVVGKSVASALPATLFIAPGGRIVYTYQGIALDDEKIRALTAGHLGIEVGA
jgi:peroxiredoxin